MANTDPSNRPGQHWVAFYYTDNECEFFDSYGLEPSYYDFDLPNVKIVNTHSLQSLSSTTCGHFCVYYLVLRSQFHSSTKIIHSLCQVKQILNDQKVTNFVKNLNSTSLTRFKLTNQCCSSQSCVRNCHVKNSCSQK